MRNKNTLPQPDICILEEQVELTLDDLRCACSVSAEKIIELVDVGVLEPIGSEPTCWSFDGISLNRARVVLRLQRDIGTDIVGAALALELLDEIKLLRTRLRAVDAGYPFDDHADEQN
ncbi:MAG: MerR family transcriptional regulator [Nitrosomonadales bacterium]|jgi:chaperone modulatory protein CbpM|nr:MAG: MerR family transcriptional regulator [Nitrosomonadales bacterium]